MKVTEHISKGGNGFFSLELLPPLKGQNIREIYDAIDPLVDYGMPFIDVTYHREEVEYRDVGNGLLKKMVVKRRPGTVGICSAIQTRYGIDAIPHVLCGGFTLDETENFLIELSYLGIENVMALRGDPVASEKYFTPEGEGHCHADELVHQIAEMNRGNYIVSECEFHNATDFCIGVAGYPEKHLEAPSMESDIHFLKRKVAAGADYVITQMFFDNSRYFEFVKRCRAEGITVPIIPGIKPLSTFKQLNTLPHKFKVDLPDDLVREVVKASGGSGGVSGGGGVGAAGVSGGGGGSSEAVREIGIEWCVQQCRELLANGVPLIHFYSNGKTESIRRIAKQLI
jgi:methylenetetrahydrofolate reductase (NADPH)